MQGDSQFLSMCIVAGCDFLPNNLGKCGHLRRVGYLLPVNSVYFEQKLEAGLLLVFQAGKKVKMYLPLLTALARKKILEEGGGGGGGGGSICNKKLHLCSV